MVNKYYNRNHIVYMDLGDPEQYIIAICIDEETAKDIAEALNKKEKEENE